MAVATWQLLALTHGEAKFNFALVVKTFALYVVAEALARSKLNIQGLAAALFRWA
ncbi:MAG: hypothetical protein ACP5QA_00550 [Phycisphaerae bacterium]